MVTIDSHKPMVDPKHPESPMCWRCHLPIMHPVHKEKGMAIKGTASPDKTG